MAQFYNFYKDENFIFKIYETDFAEMLKRLYQYQDELGFIHIVKSEKNNVQQILDKYQLMFVSIAESQSVLYQSKKGNYIERLQSELSGFIEEISSCYLENKSMIFPDFYELKTVNAEQNCVNTKIITNSSYVMEQLLKTTDLICVGSPYIMKNTSQADLHIIPLEGTEELEFGYIKHKNEELSFWVEQYVEFVQGKVMNKQ